MICINLLPWRESKLKRSSRKLMIACVLAMMLPCIIVGVIGIRQTALIDNKIGQLINYQKINQYSLSKMQRFEAAQLEQDTLNSKQIQLNRVINQRKALPRVLAELTKLNHQGRLSYLFIDHRQLLIKDYEANLDQVLSLFQLLNEHSIFCQVAFTPVTKSPSASKQVYELRAHICES